MTYVEKDPDTINFAKIEEARRWIDARNSFVYSQMDGLGADTAPNLGV